MLHNTPKQTDAVELAELDYEICLKTNNYRVAEWERRVIQLLKTVNTRGGGKTFRVV